MLRRSLVLGALLASLLALAAPALAANAPRPISLSGSGARVLSIRITRDQPVVVSAAHSGSSNFVIELIGPGTHELLVNEIGRYQGQVAWADGKSGRYHVKVEADGRWSLRFTQPVPSSGNTRIPRSISGAGSRVVAIRASHDMQPIISAANRGKDNFVVEIIGYGSTTGHELLFNEIGSYHGQTIMDSLPAGPYLVIIQDTGGAWTLKFAE
jgi:hypothetical protein